MRIRNDGAMFIGLSLLVGCGVVLCQAERAVGNPPNPGGGNAVACVRCACIYVKGWHSDFDNKYRAFCDLNTTNPAFSDFTGQSNACPGDNNTGTRMAGPNLDLVEFQTGVLKCNQPLNEHGVVKIEATVANPIQVANANVQTSLCTNANGGAIPPPGG